MTETQGSHFAQTSSGSSSKYTGNSAGVRDLGCGWGVCVVGVLGGVCVLWGCWVGCVCCGMGGDVLCVGSLSKWRLCALVSCRDVRFSSFLSEFKAGKERALELLSRLPHCIPHRQVGCASAQPLRVAGDERVMCAAVGDTCRAWSAAHLLCRVCHVSCQP